MKSISTFLQSLTNPVFILLLFLPLANLHADTIETVQAGDWNTNNTWTGGMVPSDTDNVVIKHNVTLNAPKTVLSITFTAGSLSGSYNLTANGDLTLNSGGISGMGLFNVNGDATINGGSLLGKTLVLHGASTLNNSTFSVSAGAVFRIESTGTLTILQTCNGCAVIGGNFSNPGTIDNQGTIIKNTPDNLVAFQSNTFNNSGNIQVNGGTLHLTDRGGNFTAGAVAIASGAALRLTGFNATSTYNFSGGSVTGAGALNPGYQSVVNFSVSFSLTSGIDFTHPNGGGTVNDNVGVTPAFVIIAQGGKFQGNGSPVISDSLIMSGSATIGTAGNTGTMTVNGIATITNGTIIGKNLTLNGNSTIASLYLSDNCKLTIGPNGNLTFSNSAADKISINSNPNTPGTFENCGLVGKIGIGRTIIQYCYIQSKGDMNIDEGKLRFIVPVDPTNTQGLSDGIVTIQPFASFEVQGYNPNTVFYCYGNAFVNFPPGSKLLIGGNTNVAEATWKVIGDWVASGSSEGNGTIEATGTLSAPGQLRPGTSPGTLNFNKLTFTPTTDLFIEMQGKNTPGTDYDRVAVTGLLVLDGTLKIEFLNNYIPALNDEFIIMTCGSHTGTFTQITHPGNNPNAWEIIYTNPTEIRLKLVQPLSYWYQDSDNDMFGDANMLQTTLFAPSGYVADSTDCNDANAAVFPSAPEICDALDNDCNGSPESPTNTWTANGDGLHWQDLANWSSGFVPLECQDVIVPAGANVTLPAGINGKGRTLDVPVDAQFQVEGTGVLEIGN